MSKDKDQKKEVHHTGSVSPEDAELTIWLNRLWARKEPPERLEVYQAFGRNRNNRGEMIHHEDFSAGQEMDIERVTKMSNEIIEACQNDADSARRQSYYQLAIIDRNRRSSPLIRRIGPIHTKRAYLTVAGEDGEEDEDDVPNAKNLQLEYIREGLSQARWDKNRYDKVMGEMLLLQDNIIRNQQTHIDRMFNNMMAFQDKMLEAQDRALDRELIREKEKFKLGLYKEGIRTARNLLPNIFAAREEESRQLNGNGAAASNGHSNGTASNGESSKPKQQHPVSPESTLVDNFLNDIEEEGEDLCSKLFGEYEEKNGKIEWTKQGIFTPQQFAILVGVRQRQLPASALDPLMPQSGHAYAVTEDQIAKAGDAGVTEGIGIALVELIALRNRANQPAEQTDQPTGEEK
jgi:hypothetical protein